MSSRAQDPFWTSQILRARDAARAGHGDGYHPLARTLFAAYKHGHDTFRSLPEALSIFRNLYGREPGHGSGEAPLDLGDALLAEYERTGSIQHVQEAVGIRHGASSPDAFLDRRNLQHAKGLLARGAYFGDEADLLKAKTLLDTLPNGAFDPPRTAALASYHLTLWISQDRYDRHDIENLKDETLRHLQCRTSRQRAPDALVACFKLCSMLLFLGVPADSFQDAMEIAAEVDAHLLHPPDLFAVSHALAVFYQNIARATKSWSFMSISRDFIDTAIRTSGANPLHESAAHAALGRWLNMSAAEFRVDDVRGLEQAAEAYRAASALCPPQHSQQQNYLTGFTFSLMQSWKRTGRRSCLHDVIALADRIPGSITEPPLIVNIIDALLERVKAGRIRFAAQRALLERAVRILQISIAGAAENSRYRTFLLQTLSFAYSLQVRLGIEVDSGERLSVARASAAAGAGDLCGYGGEGTLAGVLLDVAQRSKDASALDEAKSLIDIVGDDGAGGEDWALEERYYAVRYQLLGDADDSRRSWALFERRLAGPSQLPVYRLRRACVWFDVAQSVRDHDAALRAHRHIVDILSSLAHVGQSAKTRVEALQLGEGLACRAATLWLDMGRPANAVELLEQSRGVLWSQALHLRVPLASVPPQCRADFERITAALGRAENDPEALDNAERRAYAAELEALIDQIRLVPRHERFLLPSLYSDLKRCASHGFVVLVIPSDACTDVVTMRSVDAKPAHLRLPTLKLARLQRLTAKLKKTAIAYRNSVSAMERKMKQVHASHARRSSVVLEREYTHVLRELWTELVCPVLASLKVKPCSDARRSRLWWCPAGAFAELPLHAAGIYEGPDQDCASNYVVSSYTPTLSALMHAQAERCCPDPSDSSDTLVVAVPEAPGLSHLPNASLEADAIQQLVPSDSLATLSGDLATIPAVLEALPRASVLHLACHGHQTQDEPLSSGFSLYDGRLTLEQLMHMQLPKAQLAYLSACETASTGEYQPDESINLAATMLFAGFKSVIATMWSMNDLDGPFVAQRIYGDIFRGGKLDLYGVPYALDAAVRELRESGVHPSRWATYVHIGA